MYIAKKQIKALKAWLFLSGNSHLSSCWGSTIQIVISRISRVGAYAALSHLSRRDSDTLPLAVAPRQA
jgi:hypothetical protein